MDRMRKEFEAWLLAETGFDICRTNFAMTKPEDQQYMCHHTNLAWLAWKASRASLCVELPDNLDGEYYADGWNACLIAVGEKIEESGVSYK